MISTDILTLCIIYPSVYGFAVCVPLYLVVVSSFPGRSDGSILWLRNIIVGDSLLWINEVRKS